MTNQIASATLDTLQIYFPWDDDLYTYVKERGLGTEGHEKKALPLIYSDNCESTTGQEKTQRRCVLHPEYFGHSVEELGWKEGGGSKDQIVIPSEKPEAEFHLEGDELHIIINPRPDGDEEYHIEYSSRASFGKMYTNWSNFYITISSFHTLVEELENRVSAEDGKKPVMKSTDKQNKKEPFNFVEVSIDSYKFSLAKFNYAKYYLQSNGFNEDIPSLVYNSEKQEHLETMDPKLKYGTVKTKEQDDFQERERQVVFKIAQSKITQSQRGKDAKVKGALEFPEQRDNRIIVNASDMLQASYKIKEFLEKNT